MIAHRRSDVADLNQRARALLRDAGRLGPDVPVAGGRPLGVGDRVVTTRNEARLAVINGQAGTLTGLDGDRVRVEFDGGRHVDLPAYYAQEHLDHAYATTAHRAQGASVDRAFVLGSEELYREWGYTALSRHRHEARFYVATGCEFLNKPPELLRDGDVPIHVAQMLRDSRAERLAVDHARRDSGMGIGV